MFCLLLEYKLCGGRDFLFFVYFVHWCPNEQSPGPRIVPGTYSWNRFVWIKTLMLISTMHMQLPLAPLELPEAIWTMSRGNLAFVEAKFKFCPCSSVKCHSWPCHPNKITPFSDLYKIHDTVAEVDSTGVVCRLVEMFYVSTEVNVCMNFSKLIKLYN